MKAMINGSELIVFNKGKLIVIEGPDGSGKSTQWELLWKALERAGVYVGKIEFPRYNKGTGKDIRQNYLGGKMGADAKAIDPHSIGNKYAKDRFESFNEDEWGDVYRNGGVVASGRYYSANQIHQAAKIKDKAERLKYAKVEVEDYECNELGLPKPDIVFLLSLPVEESLKAIEKRVKETGVPADIHENREHLEVAYDVSLEMAKEFNWVVIDCMDENGRRRTVDDIHSQIIRIVFKELGLELPKKEKASTHSREEGLER